MAFPVQRGAWETPVPGLGRCMGSAMIKALVVDDREDYLRALRGALRRGFEVVTAQTLEEARQRLDGSIQVGLIDVRLSEDEDDNRDGVVFLQWAKDRYPTIPMIMMSAYRDFDAVVEALNLGGDYFLKKPIDIRYLKELLKEFGEEGPRPERTAALRREIGRERK